ncbi:MAG TPA: Crp/Fnr family transcriptional regulator [Spirochaetota bacterium]|nr:Crp/Fnr family transcriptional regulator [Spirochaetota bacterium]
MKEIFNDPKEIFNKSLFFGGLSPEIIDKLEKRGRSLDFAKDEIIFFEGDRGDEFFFLLSGLVRIYKSTDSDKEVVLRYIKPGEMFGEVILFDSPIYPVNAVAQRDSVLFAIKRQLFLELFGDESFVKFFVGNLFKKMRHLADRVAFLNAYDVEERFFLFINEHYGLKSVVKIDLSKAEIAEAIGTLPETLSRLLSRLKSRGIIEWDKEEMKLDIDYAASVVERLKFE